MPRLRNPYPTPRSHKGVAVIDVWDGPKRHTVTLSPWGSEQADKELSRIIAERKVSANTAQVAAAGDITVNELLEAYKLHAERHYRTPTGESTSEFGHVKCVIGHARELYGLTLAVDFGPLALKAVRQRFIDLGWARKTVNQQIERLRRAFKWAAGEELIPFEAYQRLTAVVGLQRGRTEARETEPVGPVDDQAVDATLPYLNRHVRGLVEFQRLTGCRPGEACMVRRYDIDTGGAVWQFKPPHHKGSWRGKSRTIAIGPKAQELLRGYFTPRLDDYVFSPRRAVEELRAERAAKRKTPRYPSHEKRNAAKRKASPERVPDERYTTRSYFYAVSRAVEKANAAGLKLPAWHPNQLRHTFATRVRKEHGLEAAQELLGHARADVTQIYAEKNEALAAGVAATIG